VADAAPGEPDTAGTVTDERVARGRRSQDHASFHRRESRLRTEEEGHERAQRRPQDDRQACDRASEDDPEACDTPSQDHGEAWHGAEDDGTP